MCYKNEVYVLTIHPYRKSGLKYLFNALRTATVHRSTVVSLFNDAE